MMFSAQVLNRGIRECVAPEEKFFIVFSEMVSGKLMSIFLVISLTLQGLGLLDHVSLERDVFHPFPSHKI